jgi:hypothetical protein
MNDFIKNNEAGRVVNLKKLAEPENVSGEEPAPQKREGFFFLRFNFFRRKGGRVKVDFLRHYKKAEKNDDFAEAEILKEYLKEEREKKRGGVLALFFIPIAWLWRLPLFIIKFLWILFRRFFTILFVQKSKRKKSGKKTAALLVRAAPKIEEKKLNLKKNKVMESAKPRNSFILFWQALWAAPRGIKNILAGRGTEDYLYQRVFLEEISKKKFWPFRHILSFVFFLALLILPLAAIEGYRFISGGDLRGRVLGVSEKAIGDLKSAAASASSLDLAGASADFSSARENFREANDKLSEINGLIFELAKIIPNDKIRLAAESREMLAAGEYASGAGKNLSLAAGALFTNQRETLSEKINNFLRYEAYALEDAKNMNAKVVEIDAAVLPAQYREEFFSLKEKGADLEIILSKNIELVKKLNVFLGAESAKRYLFVFENNSEMRASGGFVGSYALVDFDRGKIKNIEAPGGGSYDTEGGLRNAVIAPEPLYLVNPQWHFWDANWWPDWRKSAGKLAWFYEKSGGPTVDGVIALTPTVLEKILATIGPVELGDASNTVMTSENLWDNLRKIIEAEKSADQKLPYELAEKKPKKIIGVLLAKLLEEMPKRLDGEKLQKLLYDLEADLAEKQILLYFKDADLQLEAENRNWAGRVKETNKDYLSVVNTNIAGGKSDRKIEETISHRVEASADGSIIDSVTINRVHNGNPAESETGVRNVDWMRIYVPQGSELLEASGFRGPDPVYFSLPEEGWRIDPDVAAEEGDSAVIDREWLNTKIYSESGKTVFANWSMVDPGQTVVIKLKYRLPFKLEIKKDAGAEKQGLEAAIDKFFNGEKRNLLVYSLLVQKQAGSLFSSIDSSLSLPGDMQVVWSYPAELPAGGHGWEESGKLDSDKYFAAVIEKNSLEK